VVWQYPATKLLVCELQTMHEDGVREPSLVDLVEWLHVQHPTFTVELFLRGSDEVRSQLLDEDGALDATGLTDGSVFHSPTVFQLKALLYHCGILTERGPRIFSECFDIVGHKYVNVLVDVRGHASRRPRNSHRSRTLLVSDSMSSGHGYCESRPGAFDSPPSVSKSHEDASSTAIGRERRGQPFGGRNFMLSDTSS